MAVDVIELPNNQDAIFSYKLAGSQTLSPRSAFVHWDGSGASGPFLAALTFTAPDGKVFSRVFPSTVIPQGGAADVTYAPFPGGIGPGAPEILFSWIGQLTGENDPTIIGDSFLVQQEAVQTPSIAVGINSCASVAVVWTLGANATVQPSIINADPVASHQFVLSSLHIQDINSTDRAVYAGNLTTITPEGEGPVTVNTKLFGTDLLDITDPELSRLINAGTYAFAATIFGG